MATETKSRVVSYRLEPEESNFTVQAFAEGLFSAFGHNPVIAIRDFSGEAKFVPATLEDASLRVTVNPDSLIVSGEVREKDRAEIERTMLNDVLETTKYPEIAFTSNSVSASRIGEGRHRARIIGDLTMHGVTQKNIWISAEVTLTEKGLRARGDFSLKQTDFGIKLVSVAGGMLKLKNELKFSFDIEAAHEPR